MKSYILLALAGITLFATVSCGATAEREALADYRATAEADGVITQAELSELNRLGAAIIQAEVDSTYEKVATIAGTILFAIFGANAARNRNMPGTTRKPPVA